MHHHIILIPMMIVSIFSYLVRKVFIIIKMQKIENDLLITRVLQRKQRDNPPKTSQRLGLDLNQLISDAQLIATISDKLLNELNQAALKDNIQTLKNDVIRIKYLNNLYNDDYMKYIDEIVGIQSLGYIQEETIKVNHHLNEIKSIQTMVTNKINAYKLIPYKRYL